MLRLHIDQSRILKAGFATLFAVGFFAADRAEAGTAGGAPIVKIGEFWEAPDPAVPPVDDSTHPRHNDDVERSVPTGAPALFRPAEAEAFEFNENFPWGYLGDVPPVTSGFTGSPDDDSCWEFPFYARRIAGPVPPASLIHPYISKPSVAGCRTGDTYTINANVTGGATEVPMLVLSGLRWGGFSAAVSTLPAVTTDPIALRRYQGQDIRLVNAEGMVDGDPRSLDPAALFTFENSFLSFYRHVEAPALAPVYPGVYDANTGSYVYTLLRDGDAGKINGTGFSWSVPERSKFKIALSTNHSIFLNSTSPPQKFQLLIETTDKSGDRRWYRSVTAYDVCRPIRVLQDSLPLAAPGQPIPCPAPTPINLGDPTGPTFGGASSGAISKADIEASMYVVDINTPAGMRLSDPANWIRVSAPAEAALEDMDDGALPTALMTDPGNVTAPDLRNVTGFGVLIPELLSAAEAPLNVGGFANSIDVLGMVVEAVPMVQFCEPASTVDPEGTGANTIHPVTVCANFAPSQDLIIPYTASVVSGTGGTGCDFTFSGTVVIPAGSTMGTIDVTILGDMVDEYDEVFNITLGPSAASPPLYVLGDCNPHELTIVDDDASPCVAVESAAVSTDEGVGTFNANIILVGNETEKVIEADVTTMVGGSGVLAGEDCDFTPNAATVIFNPQSCAGGAVTAGDRLVPFPVTILDDMTDEYAETFLVVVTAARSVPVDPAEPVVPVCTPPDGDDTMEVTILDNDAAPCVAVESVTATVDESVGTHMVNLVLVGNPTEKIIDADVSTFVGGANDPAEEGCDFTATMMTVSFDPAQSCAAGVVTPGTISVPFSVPVLEDTTDEYPETFLITVTAAAANPPDPTDPVTICADDTQEVTIEDNDAAPCVMLMDSATAVIDESAGMHSVMVILSGNATEKPVSADIETAIVGVSIDPAEPECDYTTVMQTVMFTPATCAMGVVTPGVTAVQVDIPILEDLVDEYAEAFIVLLTGAMDNPPPGVTDSVTAPDPVGLCPAGLSQEVQITDNDDAPCVDIDSPAETVDESVGIHSVTISLVGNATEKLVEIDMTTDVGGMSDPAETDCDFTTTTMTLVFNPQSCAGGVVTPGVTNISFDIPILEDTVDEYTESFLARLTGFRAVPADPTDPICSETDVQEISILDNDDGPCVAVDLASSTVDESVGTHMIDIILVGNPTEKLIEAMVSTVTGGLIDPAEIDCDFTDTTTLISFAPQSCALGTVTPGVTSQPFSVPILEDMVDEYDESFLIQVVSAVSNPADPTEPVVLVCAMDTHEVTITDNDAAPCVNMELAASTVAESVGTHMINVQLTGNATEKTVLVDVSAVEGGMGVLAGADCDFTSTTMTLTFAPEICAAGVVTPGSTSEIFMVAVTDDMVDEWDETFLATIVAAAASPADPADPVTICVGMDSHEVTITDDDAAPCVMIETPFAMVAEAAGTHTVNVLLMGNATERVITADLMTAVGGVLDPAEADCDFQTLSQTVTFTPQTCAAGSVTPGVLSVPFTVTILDDMIDEYDESFLVNMTATGTLPVDPMDPDPVGICMAQGADMQEVTIVDDDAAPCVAVETLYSTVDESVGTHMINVVLVGNTTEKVIEAMVSTATGGMLDPAETDCDYTDTLTMLTFTPASCAGGVITPGVTSQAFSVDILEDTVDEYDESFLVQVLSAAANPADPAEPVVAVCAMDTHEVTITDNDAAPCVNMELTASTVAESVGTHMINVQLTGNSTEKTVLVDVSAVDGGMGVLAGADCDYTSTTMTLTFAPETCAAGVVTPGSTSEIFMVAVLDDMVDEWDETFLATIIAAAASPADPADPITVCLGMGSHEVTITDDDAAPCITLDSTTGTVAETAGTHTVTVMLTGNMTERSITATLATAMGGMIDPAEADCDYVSLMGMVSFTPGNCAGGVVTAGVTSQPFTVTIIDDLVDEYDESFLVNLLSADTVPPDLADPINVCAVAGTGSQEVTITDNDAAPCAAVETATGTSDEAAGTHTVNIILSGNASEKTILVDVTTMVGGSIDPAEETCDFTPFTTQLAFNPETCVGGVVTPGVISVPFDVTLIDDSVDEYDESFLVQITAAAASPADPGDPVTVCAADTHEATITDNDAAPCAEVELAASTVGEGVGMHSINVILTGNSTEKTIDVTVDTADGTAVETGDYTSAQSVLTFNPETCAMGVPVAGDRTMSYSVTIVDDLTQEPSPESFTINILSAAANPPDAADPVTICAGNGTHTVDITDDDVPPVAFSSMTGFGDEFDPPTTNIYTAMVVFEGMARSQLPVTVNITATDGTAVAGVNYNLLATVLNFNPDTDDFTLDGDVALPVDVEIIPNLTCASSLTFTLDITCPPTAASCGSIVTQTVTIHDTLDCGFPITTLVADFTAGDSLGWTGGVLAGSGSTALGPGGLCMSVPASGDNIVGWYSQEDYIELVDYSAYEVTLHVSTNQTLENSIPLWEILYNNFNADGSGSTFGGAGWFLDVAGGANGIGRPQGRDTFKFWFTPNAVLRPAWRGIVDPDDSAFTPMVDDSNDISLVIRLLDLASGGIVAGNDFGTVCLSGIEVRTVPFAALQSEGVIWSPTISNGTFLPQNFGQVAENSAMAMIDEGAGMAKYQLNSGLAWDQGGMGHRKSFFPWNASAPNYYAQFFPLEWTPDTLYLGAMTVCSSMEEEGTDPVDAIFLSFDTTTVELGAIHYTGSGAPGSMNHAGSPRSARATAGAEIPYVAFFHTNNATALAAPDAARLRMTADFFNTPVLAPHGMGSDPFQVEAVAVERVIVP